jgi:beta-phosphoglucomutase-like phosphatase (HAD superfamily)
MTTAPVTAVLWDYDGTLVDTCVKNMRVNQRIIQEVAGRPWTEFEVMASQEIYDLAQRRCRNWRDFYQEHFGLSEEETTLAGSRWTPYQLTDDTPTPPLEGIPEALAGFDGMPHGVVSQNCSKNIATTLEIYGIRLARWCMWVTTRPISAPWTTPTGCWVRARFR